MSTDYGFGCETCGRDESGWLREKRMVDNYRWVDELTKVLHFVVSSHAAIKTMPHGFIGENFTYAVEFASDHLKLGHVVRVCDEYGRFDGQCRNEVMCTVKVRRGCTLDKGHAGSCEVQHEP